MKVPRLFSERKYVPRTVKRKVTVPICPRIRLRLKCDARRSETRFRLSAKRSSSFKSPGLGGQFSRQPRCVDHWAAIVIPLVSTLITA